MAESIRRYFMTLPKAQSGMRCTRHIWDPAADVYRTRDGWMVKFELAGVAPDELEISIAGNTLVVAGVRRDETFSESVSCHQLEITYSRFERAISFPCPIEGAIVERRYKDGLLILHLRSPEECDEE
jgi:HSP20 family protein